MLKTIQQHNDEVLSKFGKSKNLTGIECPKCKTELQFKNKDIMYLTNPAQQDVICYNCSFQGKVYV